jgi:SAM-dependent methyltransferase
MTTVAAKGFKDHFSGHAADYAAFRPIYPPALANFLADVSPAQNMAYDCGCGNGQLSTLLAARFSHVHATDPSQQQREQATPHPFVSYSCAKAENSGLPDHSVDCITAGQAAHWFDLPAFYEEAQRIARPLAVIALISYNAMDIEPSVDRIIAHFYRNVVGPYWPPERKHIETGYKTLPFPFQEISAPVIMMTAEWNMQDVLGYISTWSAVKQAEKSLGYSPIPAFHDELVSVWADPAIKRTVRWPLALRIGRIG